MNFLSADVPDPTDFPPQSTAPGLRILDGSFRCDICGELYDAPVTISCGHCFCSACIRSSLRSKQECPSCRKSAGEAHIRPNPILENVISAWKQARPFVLGLITREKARTAEESKAASDKAIAKKRKRSIDRSSSMDGAQSSSTGISIHDAGIITPRATVKKHKPSSSRSVVPSSDAEENEVTIIGTSDFNPKDSVIVICPICQKSVRYNVVNSHMDIHERETAKVVVDSWSKLMNGGGKNNQHGKGKQRKAASDSDDEYPLPIASYKTLKDKQIKDMLSEQGLPLTGDRTTWEQRHQHWVILYNSNLDKSLPNRKSKSELKRDLKKWEEDTVKKKKHVVTDTVGYQKAHKSEFSRLIDEAKRSRGQRSVKSEDSEPSAHSTPGAQSSSAQSLDAIVVDSEDERSGVLR